MYKLQRKLLSQNFLHSPRLVEKLVTRSSIGTLDTVLEIGPGKGIITQKLLERSFLTVAIELDEKLVPYLSHRFKGKHNFLLFHNNILHMPLPQTPYKVFANLPFAIEGEIIRKLLHSANPPQDSYLVIQKELAHRFAAQYKENQFSILHKPWFSFSVFHEFKKTDFTPIPSVSATMLQITKLKEPLLPLSEKQTYQNYVQHGFTNGQPVAKNLSKIYPKKNVLAIFKKHGIPHTATPRKIPLEEWIMLYKALRQFIPTAGF